MSGGKRRQYVFLSLLSSILVAAAPTTPPGNSLMEVRGLATPLVYMWNVSSRAANFCIPNPIPRKPCYHIKNILISFCFSLLFAVFKCLETCSSPIGVPSPSARSWWSVSLKPLDLDQALYVDLLLYRNCKNPWILINVLQFPSVHPFK